MSKIVSVCTPYLYKKAVDALTSQSGTDIGSALLLGAVGLLRVVDGVLPFLPPTSWRSFFARATRLSDGQIRFIGLSSMLAGLLMLLLWR